MFDWEGERKKKWWGQVFFPHLTRKFSPQNEETTFFFFLSLSSCFLLFITVQCSFCQFPNRLHFDFSFVVFFFFFFVSLISLYMVFYFLFFTSSVLSDFVLYTFCHFFLVRCQLLLLFFFFVIFFYSFLSFFFSF